MFDCNILLATVNKLNCFISAREMLSIILHSALVLLSFFVAFYMLINHLFPKKMGRHAGKEVDR